MDLESALNELSELLYGYNYEVFLRIYKVPFVAGAGVEHYVSVALGAGTLLDCSCSVTGQEVLATVEESLRYGGDEGQGPLPLVLGSERFELLLDRLLCHIKQTTSSATFIEEFNLKDGHPAYPVFWDFAFVIAGPKVAEVLIGSSSD